MTAPTGEGAGLRHQCQLSVIRGGEGGSVHTLFVRAGEVFRVGHGRTCDFKLDVEGTSSVHCELSVRPLDASDAALCIRDNAARNGTGIRHKSFKAGEEKSPAVPWEILTKEAGGHTIGNCAAFAEGKEKGSWQLKVPYKSRKGSKQMPEATRLIEIRVVAWNKIPPKVVVPAPSAARPRYQPMVRPSYPVPAPQPVRSAVAYPVAAAVTGDASAAAAAAAVAAALEAKKKKEKKEKKLKKKEKEAAKLQQALLPQQQQEEGGQQGAEMPGDTEASKPQNRWRKTREKPSALQAAHDVYAEIDAELGLAPGVTTEGQDGEDEAGGADDAPAAGPGGKVAATRPKQKARPPGAGVAEVDSSPERMEAGEEEGNGGACAPAVANAADALAQQHGVQGIKLTAATLKAVATAAAAAFSGGSGPGAAGGGARSMLAGRLVGESVLRDMSISPISTPGVGTKKMRKKATRRAPARAPSETSDEEAAAAAAAAVAAVKLARKEKKRVGVGLDAMGKRARHAQGSPDRWNPGEDMGLKAVKGKTKTKKAKALKAAAGGGGAGMRSRSPVRPAKRLNARSRSPMSRSPRPVARRSRSRKQRRGA